MIGGMIMIKKILSQWLEPTSTKQYQFYRDGILYRIGNRQFDFKFPDITSNQMPWLRAADTLPANNWVLTTGWSPFLKNYGVYLRAPLFHHHP